MMTVEGESFKDLGINANALFGEGILSGFDCFLVVGGSFFSLRMLP